MELEDLSGRSSESSRCSSSNSSIVSNENCSEGSIGRVNSCRIEVTSDANGNGNFARCDYRRENRTEHTETDDMPVALDKPKDYAVHRVSDACNESNGDEQVGGMFRAATCNNSKMIQDNQREAMHSFCKEIREMKQKNLHAVFERTNLANKAAAAAAGVAHTKDLDFMKAYGLSFERVKELGFASRINNIAFDSLRNAAPLTGTEPSASHNSHNKLSDSLQSRLGLPGVAAHVDATLAFERLRQARHPLFQATSATTLEPATNHGNPYPQQHQQQQQQQQVPSYCGQQSQHQQQLTQISQHQHSSSQQITSHQHQHTQQPKSFTIDAILGLRHVTSHKDKHNQRQHPYRRHQGQDCSTKTLESGAVGKLKRVRTIFTTEQLERLENEFARQQYMVGPERLYLAHALGLTEAQVKVWFQNRRIKWRKVNHEKQSQRLYELHQNNVSTSDRDDSSENIAEW
ncbi:hypothetical protein QAD02_019693 [Eretmocerus hayati]|uniref:Uncharacterized protein n=1 Tax=Eretmocerus hayati TaxID=131215 RepID=A0ACC2PKB4_9HYME|nr:hypothetical protein QAD02_019693 [Eretmocerus hayati]